MAMSGGRAPNNSPPVIPPKENENIDDDSGLSVSSNNSSCSSGSDGEATANQQNPPSDRREAALARMKRETKCKSESLARFLVSATLDTQTMRTTDEIESTLLRTANKMKTKHEIWFNSMNRKLRIELDNAEQFAESFIYLADVTFEVTDTSISVTWNRIIALFALSSQLAVDFRKRNFHECERSIPIILGNYINQKLLNFVIEEGGWQKICSLYPPEDDIDNKVWNFLTIAAAVGLGTLATAFIVSKH